MIKLPEPYMIQRDFVNAYVNHNLYTEAQLKQAVRDALDEAWRVDWYELMRLGTLVTRDDAATLSDRIEEKLDALIKEIPE